MWVRAVLHWFGAVWREDATGWAEREGGKKGGRERRERRVVLEIHQGVHSALNKGKNKHVKLRCVPHPPFVASTTHTPSIRPLSTPFFWAHTNMLLLFRTMLYAKRFFFLPRDTSRCKGGGLVSHERCHKRGRRGEERSNMVRRMRAHLCFTYVIRKGKIRGCNHSVMAHPPLPHPPRQDGDGQRGHGYQCPLLREVDRDWMHDGRGGWVGGFFSVSLGA